MELVEKNLKENKENQRLESVYEIMHHYRNTSKNKLVYQFYKIAKDILDKKIFRKNECGNIFICIQI